MKRLKTLSKLARALQVGRNVWRTDSGRIVMFTDRGDEIDIGQTSDEGLAAIVSLARG